MNSAQIEKIMASSKVGRKFFRGCFPSDRLLHPYKFPSAYIVNEDPSDQSGSHWVAIYFKNFDEVYYFDSFARDPVTNIEKFLKNYKKVRKNTKIFQSPFSNTCALYCIYFICMISLNASFDQTLKTLSNNPNPDVYVQRFLKCLLKSRSI